jgi:hypothetical protein
MNTYVLNAATASKRCEPCMQLMIQSSARNAAVLKRHALYPFSVLMAQVV